MCWFYTPGATDGPPRPVWNAPTGACSVPFGRVPGEKIDAMDDPRGASVEDGRRVFFRDVKPYAIVEGLDQLRGPARGTVELSHSVLWAPVVAWSV